MGIAKSFLSVSGVFTNPGLTNVTLIFLCCKSSAKVCEIVVEGVEELKEVEFVSSVGVRYIQGYYYYRPMSQQDIFAQNLLKDFGSEQGASDNSQATVTESV